MAKRTPKASPEQLAALALKRAVFQQQAAGLSIVGRGLATAVHPDTMTMLDVQERITLVLHLFQTPVPETQGMTFFIFYDIENDRIRSHVAKYLLRMGCERIQKSVFLARLDRNTYQNISKTLASVKAGYENQDSIMLVPVPEDDVRSMQIIGQREVVDVLMSNQRTLFF